MYDMTFVIRDSSGKKKKKKKHTRNNFTIP